MNRERTAARDMVAAAASLLILCPALVVAISIGAAGARRRAVAEMTDLAARFLAQLTGQQRAAALLRWDDPERFDWGYTPRRRRGVAFKQLDANQRRLAQELWKSALSQVGYRKATDIIRLESVLREIEGVHRDPDLYFLSFFGAPSAQGPWGWRLEGHHLSLNFTLMDGSVTSVTPSFFGANPATVRTGPLAGLRALAAEEDRARELLTSLDESQRARAVFAGVAPSEILTGDARKVDPLAPAGLPARDLTAAQRLLLRRLLDEYISRMQPEVARERLERIETAGLDNVSFAWAGGSRPGEPHY